MGIATLQGAVQDMADGGCTDGEGLLNKLGADPPRDQCLVQTKTLP